MMDPMIAALAKAFGADVLVLSECMEQIFQFDDPEEGKTYHIRVDALRKHLEALPDTGDSISGMAPVTREMMRHVANFNGIEDVKLERLMFAPPEIINQRVIFLDWGNGYHVLADGNHRYVLRALCEIKTIPAYMVPRDIWEPFALTQEQMDEYIKETMAVKL